MYAGTLRPKLLCKTQLQPTWCKSDGWVYVCVFCASVVCICLHGYCTTTSNRMYFCACEEAALPVDSRQQYEQKKTACPFCLYGSQKQNFLTKRQELHWHEFGSVYNHVLCICYQHALIASFLFLSVRRSTPLSVFINLIMSMHLCWI